MESSRGTSLHALGYAGASVYREVIGSYLLLGDMTRGRVYIVRYD
jgi:hypothetical protein